jgi:hypothetical protein
VAYVLIKAYYALTEPPFAVACAFGIFVILFILFTISFVIFLSTKRYLALVLTIVFLVSLKKNAGTNMICGAHHKIFHQKIIILHQKCSFSIDFQLKNYRFQG